MDLVDDGSAVIIRFAPFTAEGIAKSVNKQAILDRRSGTSPVRKGLSVFSGVKLDGETIDEAVARLCRSVKDSAGGERVAVLTESTLNSKGFVLHLNEPPPAHYLVGKPDIAEEPGIDGLVSLFSTNRMKNPAHQERSSR